jgi:metal-responsive CopG/Arc/MetJ family transcriptional regulator
MEKRTPISIKLPPSLIAEVDEALRSYEYPPTRTEVIERLLREWVESRRGIGGSGSKKGEGKA